MVLYVRVREFTSVFPPISLTENQTRLGRPETRGRYVYMFLICFALLTCAVTLALAQYLLLVFRRRKKSLTIAKSNAIVKIICGRECVTKKVRKEQGTLLHYTAIIHLNPTQQLLQPTAAAAACTFCPFCVSLERKAKDNCYFLRLSFAFTLQFSCLNLNQLVILKAVLEIIASRNGRG